MLKILFTETGDTGFGGSYHSLKNLVELISEEVECHVLYSNDPRVYPEGKNIYIYRAYDPITTRTIFRGFLNKVYYKLIRLFSRQKKMIDSIFRRSFLCEINKIVKDKKIDIIHTNNQPFRDDFILYDNQNHSVGLVSHIRTENIKGISISHDPKKNIRYISVSRSVESLWSKALNYSNSYVLNNFLMDNIEKNNEKIKHSYCYLGRLVGGKGIFELLDAHVEILKTFPDARLSIIGDGPLREDVESKIDELQVPFHSISVVGFVDKPKKYLSEIEAIVLPSEKEGFGRVLIEGMAQGCVAIGTRTGGIKDIIVDGENGFFLEEVSSDEIKKKVLTLFGDSDLLNKYRENSYEYIRERFSPEQYKAKIISIYREIT